jgi:hypothetical protein
MPRTAPIGGNHRGWHYDAINGRLVASFNGTEVFDFDADDIAVAIALLSVNATAGIGYGTGAGGAVTQGTSKTTGVTLNTVTGTITTDNAALAAAAEATFTVTNSAVALTDTIVLSIQSGGTSGEYLAHVSTVTAGSFDITLANMSGASASDAVLINFAVIKGVAA